MEGEFCLIQDDSCHWYVIPADKRQEAVAYLEAVARYWEDDDPSGPCPVQPAWFQAVGGSPGLVKFKSYRIGG